MKLKFLFIVVSFLLVATTKAQNPAKKKLGHEELVSWNKIISPTISNDGKWVVYVLKPEEGDAEMKIYEVSTGKTTSVDRGEKPVFSEDSRFLVFEIHPPNDTVRSKKLADVKKEDLPKKSLGIMDLQNAALEKITNVKSFSLPKEWNDWVVYQMEPAKKEKGTGDDEKNDKKGPKKKKKVKKENAKNGTKLVIKNLKNGATFQYPFVVNYQLAEEGAKVAWYTTGDDQNMLEGIYVFDVGTSRDLPIFRQKGDYKNLVFDKMGEQLVFHVNLDTTEAAIPPFELAYWKEDQDSASLIADKAAGFLPDNWIISQNKKPQFSKDGSKLFFGMAPPPILEDSTLLEEEMVQVEVWHWQDARLYPQQKVRQKREERRAYDVVWHTDSKKFVSLGSLDIPEIRTADEANSNYVLGYNDLPYLRPTSWEGSPSGRDIYLIDVKNGAERLIAKGVKGFANFSPKGKFLYAYINQDSAWYAYSVTAGTTQQLTNDQMAPFYDETNDRPMHPYPYGIAGWTTDDQYVLIYDRYDIWKIDPTGKEKAINLTKGRGNRLVHRYIRLDPDQRNIDPSRSLLLHIFDENTKEGGYKKLNMEDGSSQILTKGKSQFSRRVNKAKNAEQYLFTKEDFNTFPDLQLTGGSFEESVQVSTANPQQKEFSWGKMELYEWTSLDGKKLQGLLLKPENFDPSKKYPMIVNFYETSSNGLYNHRAPYPHRSTINYSFYVSRGYVIFNPDIPYRVGYPGESCYNSVIPGVTALINEGFIDKDRIGVQGHSWGGYQIAYLLTKTNIFKCAESGAPVVNMFSAYGGIRWGTGISRMFQYEHTQSRIGGTIWEYPLRYIENSPLFELDKTNTPVLILHNDKDGAVPWYQGIEYFVGLRRLNKPAWLLNYNNEPHWPLKLPNRKDFNIRMQQFFDYYLMDAPKPVWMSRGVPAIEKGKRQGLELEDELKN